MVLRNALASVRLHPGQLVRFAHPLNDGEERQRFTLEGIENGRAAMREAGTDTITTCAAWEVEAAEEASQ